MRNVYSGCSIEKRPYNQSDTYVFRYEIPTYHTSVNNNLLRTWLSELTPKMSFFLSVSIDFPYLFSTRMYV